MTDIDAASLRHQPCQGDADGEFPHCSCHGDMQDVCDAALFCDALATERALADELATECEDAREWLASRAEGIEVQARLMAVLAKHRAARP